MTTTPRTDENASRRSTRRPALLPRHAAPATPCSYCGQISGAHLLTCDRPLAPRVDENVSRRRR